jgi:hypothetical protein
MNTSLTGERAVLDQARLVDTEAYRNVCIAAEEATDDLGVGGIHLKTTASEKRPL